MEEKALAVVAFDGDELEVVELDGAGWVSLPSLLAPFGKRADNAAGLLDGWARTRVVVLTSRKGEPGNPRTTLVHVEDAPLLIARLDHRGMSDEVKAKHSRYLQHVAHVLADHFGLRRAAPPLRDAVLDMALGILGRESEALKRGLEETKARIDAKADRAEVDAATRTAETAARDAKEARKIAEHARALAGSRSVLDAVAEVTDPGRASATPDGTFSRKPREGFKSMRTIAKDYALPFSGPGGTIVARIAEAVGVFENADLFDLQSVVIGGREKGAHRVYAPSALELLDKPLRTAHGVMVGLGYVATAGGAMRAMRVGIRSKSWTVRQMVDAAIAATAPPPDGEQAGLPFDRKAS
jgi:hypothetical protein